MVSVIFVVELLRRKDSDFYSYAHKEKTFFFKMIHQQRLFATITIQGVDYSMTTE